MEGERSVQLLIRNRALRQALASSLASAGTPASEISTVDGLTGPSLRVISTTVDITPDDCRHLSARGALVVILATLPGIVEESRYREAGAAAYLPMGMASHALADELRVLLDGNSPR